MGDSTSRYTGTWFNVDSIIWKKSGKDTRFIIESKSEEITNLLIGITFILKFNFEKMITCRNVKMVLEILGIESWFSSAEGMWMGEMMIQVQKLWESKLAQECYLV